MFWCIKIDSWKKNYFASMLIWTSEPCHALTYMRAKLSFSIAILLRQYMMELLNCHLLSFTLILDSLIPIKSASLIFPKKILVLVLLRNGLAIFKYWSSYKVLSLLVRSNIDLKKYITFFLSWSYFIGFTSKETRITFLINLCCISKLFFIKS